MARTSGTGSGSKTTVTKTRTKRNGVTGTLVRTTTSGSSSSKPKKTYAQLAREGGNVAAAKAYNAKKKSTTESFRADAPKKMAAKKASISTPSTKRKLAGSKMKTYPLPEPRKRTTGGEGGGSGKGKGKLKRKIKKTVAKTRAKSMASRTRKVSRSKSKCGAKGCKAPRKYRR